VLLRRFTLVTATSLAGTLAFELLKLARGGEITTVAPGLKLAPISVSWTCWEAWGIKPGATWVSVGGAGVGVGGAAGVTVSGTELLGFPIEGSKTVISKIPGVAMSEGRIVAVSCRALTNVVCRALPLTWTSVRAVNAVPFTVKVKAGPPAVTDEGLMEVMVCWADAWLQEPRSTRARMARDETPLDRFTRSSP
jgi:hypothetical protein